MTLWSLKEQHLKSRDWGGDGTELPGMYAFPQPQHLSLEVSNLHSPCLIMLNLFSPAAIWEPLPFSSFSGLYSLKDLFLSEKLGVHMSRQKKSHLMDAFGNKHLCALPLPSL